MYTTSHKHTPTPTQTHTHKHTPTHTATHTHMTPEQRLDADRRSIYIGNVRNYYIIIILHLLHLFLLLLLLNINEI